MFYSSMHLKFSSSLILTIWRKYTIENALGAVNKLQRQKGGYGVSMRGGKTGKLIFFL